MTLIPYILIAIPTCLLAIAVWTYFDYRKYKKKNSLILLLFLFIIGKTKCERYKKRNAIIRV